MGLVAVLLNARSFLTKDRSNEQLMGAISLMRVYDVPEGEPDWGFIDSLLPGGLSYDEEKDPLAQVFRSKCKKLFSRLTSIKRCMMKRSSRHGKKSIKGHRSKVRQPSKRMVR